MWHVLQMSEEYIEKYLRLTGQTREEVEARFAADRERDMRDDFDESDWVQGCDPSQREKFTMPIAFEIVGDDNEQENKE
ncbi:hypothetical protein AB8S08_11515 [Pseudidiomarina sp. PP-1MA]|uniref:Uncharacterized protein n=2 Tax=Idiomarinaceae TaxID=267893 RepID=A0A432VWJ1_9GAMM|nr:hypothetical protein [Aliidiomarina iranensis]RUO20928.1 hypothetical protein CWE08_07455 [Aliidiomarina iranensis]